MKKIIVCIKQVPEVSEIKFDPEKKTIIREGVPNAVNAFDRRAVTQAVQLKEQFGGEVIVLTMGPLQAKEALVECLAMGADRAIHLVDKEFAGADTLATSRALALAIKRLGDVDLIFCGKYSVDAETGQVGPEVAQLLDIPQATGVTGLEFSGTGGRIRVERETDEGFETIECQLPALLTVAERLIRPIKVKPEAVRAMEGTKRIEIVTAKDLSEDTSLFGFSGSPTAVMEIQSVQSRRKRMVIKEGTAEAAASKLTTQLLDLGLFKRWEGLEKEPTSSTPLYMSSPRPKDGPAIWVVAETVEGKLRNVTFELLGKSVELAQQLGGPVAAVLIGNNTTEHIKTVGAYGADIVYVLDHENLVEYSSEGYAAALVQLIERYHPHSVLIPSTANGRDFAPRVAARLQLGLTGDCVGLEINEHNQLVQLKPAFGGNIIAPILSATFPQMATVRPGMLEKCEPDWSRAPEVVRVQLDDFGPIRARIVSRRADATESIQLDDAEIIVCVGAGIGGPEKIPLIRELAKTLGAAMGATRRVVDQGWLPRQYQIGLTGRSVKPKLYLGVAVRGATNHTIGIQRAGIIVGINSDPEAPIFQASDYGILGDFNEVVPALIKALAAAKG